MTALVFKSNFYAPNFSVLLKAKDDGKLTGTITLTSGTPIDLKGLFVINNDVIELSFYVVWEDNIYSFFAGYIENDVLTLTWLFINDKGAPFNGMTCKGSSVLLSKNKVMRENPYPEFSLKETYFVVN